MTSAHAPGSCKKKFRHPLVWLNFVQAAQQAHLADTEIAVSHVALKLITRLSRQLARYTGCNFMVARAIRSSQSSIFIQDI